MAQSILLADDSVTIQKVVELTFLDRDYDVTSVSNGDEAIEELRRKTPDLVVADVHMPGAGGYEVCRQAKLVRPELPVLLLVGTFEPFSEEDSRACGADGYLKKPFDSQELLRRVEQLLERGSSPAEAVLSVKDSGLQPILSLDQGLDPKEASGESAIGSEVMVQAPFDLSDDSSTGEPLVPAAEESRPPAPAEVAAASSNGGTLSADDVESIARRVVELIGEKVVREVAWDVVPDLAEVVIKDRLRQLEQEVEGP